MDIAALRRFDTEGAVTQFFNQYSRRMTYADQDVLNGVFRGKIGTLPAEYNVMTVIPVSYTHLLCGTENVFLRVSGRDPGRGCVECEGEGDCGRNSFR